jgi:hypothetical protein
MGTLGLKIASYGMEVNCNDIRNRPNVNGRMTIDVLLVIYL